MASDHIKKRRAFSLFAVVLMLATAFAGISFIGSAMVNEDSSAGGGSQSNPLNSISYDAYNASGTYYVKVGGSVSISAIEDYRNMIAGHVLSVTSGYGLSVSNSSLSGTISKAGTISVSIEKEDEDGSWNASVTIVAVAAVTNYTVTISAGSGGSVSKSSVSVPSGTSISTSGKTLTIGSNTITATANSGYSFSSWSNASGTVTSNRTITANFSQNQYTCYLHYDANGGSGAPSTQSYTGTSTSNHSFTVSSTTPSKSGYTFLGWSTSSSATSASYSGGSSISVGYNSSKTLYAVWQVNTTTYYAKLAFDANGGSGAPSQQSTSGNYTSNPGSYTFTISSTTPTRSGYTFLGWSTSSTATSPSYYAGGTISVNYSTSSTAKVSLYAVWQQNSISFTSANGTDAMVTGNTFSYTPTFNTSGVSVSVSGASWLSVSNGTVTGTPSTPETYNVTLTATKSNWTSATQSFTITVAERLGFTSEPTGNIAVTEA